MWAPGRSSRHGRQLTSRSTPRRSIQCIEGSYSTSSTRWPKRSCWCRRGTLRCARRRWPSASSDITTAPRSRRRSVPHSPPSRATASRSARSVSYALWPRNGGTWLITSCVTAGPRPVVAMGGLLEVGVDRVEREADQGGDGRLVAAVGQRLLHGADERGGDDGRVERRELAGVGALAQQRGEDLAVAALVAQPGLLDVGVDRLGQQRVREDRGRERPAAERLDRRGEPVGRAAVAVRDAGHQLGFAVARAAEDLGAQRALGREVAVDRAGRDARAARDVDDVGPRPAALGDELVGGGEDRLTGGGAA